VGKASRNKLSARVRRASETNDAVERIIGSINNLTAEVSVSPQARENLRRLRQGQEARWSQDLIDRFGAATVMATSDRISRIAVVDLWRREGRRAYDIHPEMAASLYRADLKGAVPGGLFDRLPHINPMLPLPRPWPFTLPRDGARPARSGLIRGYFITGVVGRRAFCPTTDKRADSLGIMPWIEWEGADPTTYKGAFTPLFVLPPTQDPFTINDIIEHTTAWHGAEPDDSDRKTVRQILPGALTLMMYLCADNRDVQEPAHRGPGASKRGKTAPPRDPFYVRVGWHIGPKLHAARMLAQGGGRLRDGVSVPSGVEYGPQHRVGHFKLVHHGPGRSQQTFTWLDPYWTKLDLLEQMWANGEEPGTGIIPVDAQTRDPARHRDVKLANLGRAKEKEIREREAQRAREGRMEW
jgi:hypothetical protein